MRNILNISEASNLAVHSLAFMATHGNGSETVFSSAEIGKELTVSESHLSKVLQRLAKTALVHSQRGAHGGFRLSKSPEEITLWEVIEIIEGPVSKFHCLLGEPICPNGKCRLTHIHKRIHKELKAELTAIRLADFIDEGWEAGC